MQSLALRYLTTTTSRSGYGGRDRSVLDVYAREVEVFVCVGVAVAWQLEYTDVPVCAVAACARADGRDGLDEGVAACRVPETDGVGREVDLVGNIVPDSGFPVDAPFPLPTDHPLQLWVRSSSCARDPAALELREVRLEKGDLMFLVCRRSVLILALDAEVVEHLAGGDGSRGLGDELRAPHVLTVPVCAARQGDLGALG